MLSDEALIGVAAAPAPLPRRRRVVRSVAATRGRSPLPAAFRDGTISHNDPNLDNVIFDGGVPVALIDFDLASPGSAVWDVACAARLWAPLRDPVDVPEPVAAARSSACGSSSTPTASRARDRARVVDAMVDAHDWCYRIVRGAVQNGHEPFQRMWHEGGEPTSGSDARMARAPTRT